MLSLADLAESCLVMIMHEYLSRETVNEILKAHNKYRKGVGVPYLTWDEQLAADAKKWARHLNHDVHHLQHSGTANGENLAWGQLGSWTNAVNLLASEKKHFKNGKFPNICKDNGDWRRAGHYSQIIWKNTKKVGAGKSGNYWVFRYSPAGNVIGQKAYSGYSESNSRPKGRSTNQTKTSLVSFFNKLKKLFS